MRDLFVPQVETGLEDDSGKRGRGRLRLVKRLTILSTPLIPEVRVRVSLFSYFHLGGSSLASMVSWRALLEQISEGKTPWKLGRDVMDFGEIGTDKCWEWEKGGGRGRARAVWGRGERSCTTS